MITIRSGCKCRKEVMTPLESIDSGSVHKKRIMRLQEKETITQQSIGSMIVELVGVGMLTQLKSIMKVRMLAMVIIRFG